MPSRLAARRWIGPARKRGVPYRLPANQAFFEAGKGLAYCLRELGKSALVAEVVARLLECDPSDPLGLGGFLEPPPGVTRCVTGPCAAAGSGGSSLRKSLDRLDRLRREQVVVVAVLDHDQLLRLAGGVEQSLGQGQRHDRVGRAVDLQQGTVIGRRSWPANPAASASTVCTGIQG